IEVPNPWLADRSKPSVGTIRVFRKGTPEPQVHEITADNTSFGLEIDFAGRAILAGRTEAAYPAMTPADTMGNLKTLDKWRESIGLTYSIETPEKMGTITGRPLTFARNSNMKYGRIEGLDKQVSRLIMGCDNQQNYPHAAVMFDDWFERGGNAFDTAYIYG